MRFYFYTRCYYFWNTFEKVNENMQKTFSVPKLKTLWFYDIQLWSNRTNKSWSCGQMKSKSLFDWLFYSTATFVTSNNFFTGCVDEKMSNFTKWCKQMSSKPNTMYQILVAVNRFYLTFIWPQDLLVWFWLQFDKYFLIWYLLCWLDEKISPKM